MYKVLCIVLLSTLSLLSLSGCGGNKRELISAAQDAQQTYDRAASAMATGQFELAISYFQILESRYPFSIFALQAQLDLAYAYYRFGRPAEAISEAERFIRFNPTHENVDYAYYIRGVANFGQKKYFLQRFFKRDPAKLNQKALQDAYNDFEQLVTQYPNSVYAADAQQRLVFLRNTLADHEIYVANFYLEREAWVAAANRANNILANFSSTPANQEALVILARAYKALNLDDALNETMRILKLNYPQNDYLRKSS